MEDIYLEMKLLVARIYTFIVLIDDAKCSPKVILTYAHIYSSIKLMKDFSRKSMEAGESRRYGEKRGSKASGVEYRKQEHFMEDEFR